MREVVLAHYDEIALKRGRRPYYEKRLVTAIENACRDLGMPGIRPVFDRIVVSGGKTEIPVDVLVDRLSRVFGIRYLLPGWMTAGTASGVLEAVARTIELPRDAQSFGVRVRRRKLPGGPGSLEVAAEIGDFVSTRTGWKVDLRDPDVWLDVVFFGSQALVAARRVEGPGGLPIGTTGHAVALVSGGIDSPVAAWLMMGRGLKISIVHFHSAPFTGKESLQKVRELTLALSRWQPTIEVAFIPFAELQRKLVASTPPQYRVILYRRFMVRIAEGLARAVGASCLVTGDALAQVASQTVENLGTIDAAASMPVLRPLIGMPKSQLIDLARKLGTYEVSIRRHDDCCAFLLPDRVATITTAAELADVERDLPVEDMVAAAIAGREVVNLKFEQAGEKGAASSA
jgi:thiamine biosynthesis protein ThiI